MSVTVTGFITAQRDEHQVAGGTRPAGVLQVSPAWFYQWRYSDASPRPARRAELAIAIGPAVHRTPGLGAE